MSFICKVGYNRRSFLPCTSLPCSHAAAWPQGSRHSMFALILQVGTCRALHSECVPSHSFTHRKYGRSLRHIAKMGVNSARPFPCGVGSLRILHSRPAVHTQIITTISSMLAHLLSVKTILFYASIIGLFSLDNKKENSFFWRNLSWFLAYVQFLL